MERLDGTERVAILSARPQNERIENCTNFGLGLRGRGENYFLLFVADQRFRAARFAISERRFEVSDFALAFPPFNPPNLPSATAWGFLPSSIGASLVFPVARSTIAFASSLGSRGLLGLLFMLQYSKFFLLGQA